MKFSRSVFFCLSFVGVIHASLFSDIVRGIFTTNRFSKLLEDLPSYFIKSLENNENEAGTFICQLREGSVPQAFLGVATDVLDEAESDISGLVTVVEQLPELAEDLWDDITNEAVDVASVISNLVENPEGELTAIVGGVETVVESVWAGVTSVWNGFTHGVDCFFDPKNPRCQPQSATNNVEADISSLCDQYIMYPATVTASMDVITTDLEPAPTAMPVQTYTPITSTSVDYYDTPTSTLEPIYTPIQSDTPMSSTSDDYEDTPISSTSVDDEETATPSTSVDNQSTPTTSVEPTSAVVESNIPVTFATPTTPAQTYKPTSVMVSVSYTLTTAKPTKVTKPSQTSTTSASLPGSAQGTLTLLSTKVAMACMIFFLVIFITL